MTVIAVEKTKKEIRMSCDSQTSAGKNKFDKDNGENRGKIFFTKDFEMVIGSAGRRSESNLMKLFSKNHKPKSGSCDDVLDYFLEFRDWVAKKTGEAGFKSTNQYIVVFEKKIFDVWAGDVEEKQDFWAIGSGMFLALSALHFGHGTEKAIEVAKKYDLFCGGKTQTLKIKI